MKPCFRNVKTVWKDELGKAWNEAVVAYLNALTACSEFDSGQAT
jgi:hypothetical protein